MNKLSGKKITVADMAPHIHVFLPTENKVNKIFDWIKKWIDLSLECNKINPYDLMPSKADLACHIGVSQGTIQNAFRLLEDIDYLESKQRIGTYIKDRKNQKIEKLTSKRELAIEIIKKYILENNYKQGDKLVSIRNLARNIGMSNATLRMATINLVSIGILSKYDNNFIIEKTDFKVKKIQTETLVEKIANEILDEIRNLEKENIDFLTKGMSEIQLELKRSIKTEKIQQAYEFDESHKGSIINIQD